MIMDSSRLVFGRNTANSSPESLQRNDSLAGSPKSLATAYLKVTVRRRATLRRNSSPMPWP